MLRRDSAFLARLVSGHLEGERGLEELSRVSPVFRPMAERLLRTPLERRQFVWIDFLAGRLRLSPVDQAPSSTVEPAVPVSPGQATTPADRPEPLSAKPDGGEGKHERRVKLTRAVDLGSRQVEWLWPGRVPLGMITMFAGDPKLGKSYVTLAMAAAVSRGLPLPMGEFPNRPGSVILMSAEDDPARTIVPRLTAAGADLTKVYILESLILANGSETLPCLRADIDAIAVAAAKLGDCRLIVIDPVSAYLKGVDDNRNAVLRGVLAPLKTQAEALDAAVVLVSHLSKGASANGKHRVLGSIAYVGACRANFLFVADPLDPTGRRVLLLDNGGNVAPPAPTLAYVIDDRGSGPVVAWADESARMTVEEALRARHEFGEDNATEAHECDQWLGDRLRNKPAPAIEVFKAAIDAGYSRDQVKRAKHRLGAVAHKQGFQHGAQWIWQLPTG